jgi:hypothetical protein
MPVNEKYYLLKIAMSEDQLFEQNEAKFSIATSELQERGVSLDGGS